METPRATLALADEGPSSPVYDVASLPGFRFHPTEEELVEFYLMSMVVGSPRLEVELINVLDLYRYDPWELPAMAFMQSEREWLFFCPRDRKYPNGGRPNRMTASGYWKATGTDRYVRRSHDSKPIGLKKTLVFYTGKAPKGRKTEWIMNEYRLPRDEQHLRSFKDPEVVLCRIYKKPAPNPCTTTLGFDLSRPEFLGAKLSSYTAELRNPCGQERNAALHNALPCSSTSTRSGPASPSSSTLPNSCGMEPIPNAVCATERLNIQTLELRSISTTATSVQQQNASRIIQTRSVKTETGTLSSVVYPFPEKFDPVADARLAQLMEAEDRRGRSFRMNAPQSRIATPPVALHQDPFDRVRDHAACSSSNLNPTMSASLDRLLEVTMWSSPLAPQRDDLLPSPSSFFSVNQLEWNYNSAAPESPQLHSSSGPLARPALLQEPQGGHFQ